MTNSRAKGKVGELQLAALLREHGFDAKRGQQFKGGEDSPDVTGLPGIHIECKRTEAGNPYKWMEQAEADAGLSFPMVAHRKNGKPWLAIMNLEDFLTLFKRLLEPSE